MASADVVHLKDSTFQTEVLKSEVPVLVDFWAVWCGPCKAIAPMVDELATQYKGKVKIAKMDVDHERKPDSTFFSARELIVVIDRSALLRFGIELERVEARGVREVPLEEPQERSVELASLGLPAGERVVAFEFWEEKLLPAANLKKLVQPIG